MDRVRSFSTLSRLVVLSLASSGLSQDLSSTIVGCDELGCPLTSGDDYTCTVANDTFASVGLTRIPGVPDAYSGISLVKGVNMSAADTQDRKYQSVYYLGAPASLSIDSLDGCAVVFHSTVNGPEFNGSSLATDQGTCPDVIAQTCIDALTQRATSIASNSTSESACDSLRDSLNNSTLSECADMVGTGKGLGNFTVTALSDLSPITSSQNSSSDCWPITPKTDSLARIVDDTALDGYTEEEIEDQLYKVTPVLTLFLGNDSSTDSSSSQLSCLKVISEKALDAGSGSANSGSKNTHSLVAVAATLLAMMALC